MIVQNHVQKCIISVTKSNKTCFNKVKRSGFVNLPVKESCKYLYNVLGFFYIEKKYLNVQAYVLFDSTLIIPTVLEQRCPIYSVYEYINPYFIDLHAMSG